MSSNIKIVRFDFSKYRRENVPEELTLLREEITGIPREYMKFWALNDANCESANIIEDDYISNFRIVYIANAELADKIVRPPTTIRGEILGVSIPIIENEKITKRKFLYTIDEVIEEYVKSFKKVSNDEDLKIFRKYFTDDYEHIGVECIITPFYPEIITDIRK